MKTARLECKCWSKYTAEVPWLDRFIVAGNKVNCCSEVIRLVTNPLTDDPKGEPRKEVKVKLEKEERT